MIKRCKGHAPVLRDLFPWPDRGVSICYCPRFPARRARVWPIGAPPINANAGLCMEFVYGVQEIRLISPDNFADGCWESNFPHRPRRTSAIVLQRATGSVQADK